jgi:hypothetical protein
LLDRCERERIEEQIRELRRLAKAETDLDALHRAQDEFARSTLHLAEIGVTQALRSHS